jgi:hypothetical protein
MAIDLGTCWSCITDVTTPATLSSGNRCVAEAIARRWGTPRGGLIDDPNYGYDLTDAIGDDLNKSDLAKMAHFAAAEAEKDERVDSADVTIQLIGAVLIVSGTITTARGPFQLVVSVSNVTVTLLSVSGK